MAKKKGLGQAPPALIKAIADAIEHTEGFYPGSRAFRNNNPGNIWDGLGPGKTKRIWPQYPLDDKDFLILPDYATGRGLMEGQINLKISRGASLTQLINEWDSGDPQATRDVYVAAVVQRTGLDPLVALNTMGDFAPPNPTKPPAG